MAASSSPACGPMTEARPARSSVPEGGMCFWYNSRRRSFLRRPSSWQQDNRIERPRGPSGASWGHLSRTISRRKPRTARRRTKVPGRGEVRGGGAAYRNRTDDLRITRGMTPRTHAMTCTETTADRTGSADCTGISRPAVPRPVPRASRHHRRPPQDQGPFCRAAFGRTSRVTSTTMPVSAVSGRLQWPC